MATIMIGADPELVLTDGEGNLLYAGDYLRFDADFGVDGHAAIAELRPHPATSSLQLVANIRKIMKTGIENIPVLPKAGWLAGHYKLGKPIGGHIHLSGYDGSANALGRRLDAVLGTLSDCIDELDERERRRAEGYGSGWRTDTPHGGIEYRMPGSWLLSPQVAFLNLWLAEATTIEWCEGVSLAFDKLQEFGGCDGIIAFAKAVSNVSDKDLFLKVADKVFSHLPLDWEEDIKEVWV